VFGVLILIPSEVAIIKRCKMMIAVPRFLLAVALALPFLATNVSASEIVRFDFPTTPVEEPDAWLTEQGFVFERDAKNRNRVGLEFGERGLTIDAKQSAFGLIGNERFRADNVTTIELDWGVLEFPEGASYEAGIRNEALMVYVFIGEEKRPSGSVFVPDSPYFFGLFLCTDKDRVRTAYVGSYFKNGGRFICLDQPATGQPVTSTFNIADAFVEHFATGHESMPPITGVALSVDTKESENSGRASAFIKEIRFNCSADC
jgi:hypothetical protein